MREEGRVYVLNMYCTGKSASWLQEIEIIIMCKIVRRVLAILEQ